MLSRHFLVWILHSLNLRYFPTLDFFFEKNRKEFWHSQKSYFLGVYFQHLSLFFVIGNWFQFKQAILNISFFYFIFIPRTRRIHSFQTLFVLRGPVDSSMVQSKRMIHIINTSYRKSALVSRVAQYNSVWNYMPTGFFEIWEPQNPGIDIVEQKVHKVCWGF